MRFLGWIRKAITGGLTTGGAAAVAALKDGSLSEDDWVLIVGSLIVGGVAVFLVPNRATPN